MDPRSPHSGSDRISPDSAAPRCPVPLGEGAIVLFVPDPDLSTAGLARGALDRARRWGGEGHRILLVDLGVVEPVLGVPGTGWEIAEADGWSDGVLLGSSPARIIRSLGGFVGVSGIASGSPVPDPRSVLDHPRSSALLEELRAAGWVLLLVPPPGIPLGASIEGTVDHRVGIDVPPGPAPSAGAWTEFRGALPPPSERGSLDGSVDDPLSLELDAAFARLTGGIDPGADGPDPDLPAEPPATAPDGGSGPSEELAPEAEPELPQPTRMEEPEPAEEPPFEAEPPPEAVPVLAEEPDLAGEPAVPEEPAFTAVEPPPAEEPAPPEEPDSADEPAFTAEEPAFEAEPRLEAVPVLAEEPEPAGEPAVPEVEPVLVEEPAFPAAEPAPSEEPSPEAEPARIEESASGISESPPAPPLPSPRPPGGRSGPGRSRLVRALPLLFLAALIAAVLVLRESWRDAVGPADRDSVAPTGPAPAPGSGSGEVSSADSSPADPSSAPGASRPDSFYLSAFSLSAHPDADRAEEVALRISGRIPDLPVVVAPVRVEGREWHRVLVLVATDSSAAEALRGDLAPLLPGEASQRWVVRRVSVAFLLGDFGTADEARAEQVRLSGIGIPTWGISLPGPEETGIFRVLGGAYADRPEAEAMEERIRSGLGDGSVHPLLPMAVGRRLP